MKNHLAGLFSRNYSCTTLVKITAGFTIGKLNLLIADTDLKRLTLVPNFTNHTEKSGLVS